MKILAIETSCDETAVCVLEASGSLDDACFSILGNALFSQAHLHKEYGGVYPNLAKREHDKNIIPLLNTALTEACLAQEKKRNAVSDPAEKTAEEIIGKVKKIFAHSPELLKQFWEYIPTIERPDIDAIAFTRGPGLEPALWVGINFADALSNYWNIPLIPVNHMEGHIVSSLVEKIEGTKEGANDVQEIYKMVSFEFPALALLLSGAHTEFDLVTNWTKYETLGATLDDAVGEAYDKVARMLNLPYPGGPEISKLAEKYMKDDTVDDSDESSIKLPRPMIKTDDLDFSFSGLKTAVLYVLRDNPTFVENKKETIAYAFESAVVDVILAKTKSALETHCPKTLIIGGGVAGNKRIREALTKLVSSEFSSISFCMPRMELTTDNAIMIGMAGYVRHKTNTITKGHDASGRLSLSQS